jgi:hypothetical protein
MITAFSLEQLCYSLKYVWNVATDTEWVTATEGVWDKDVENSVSP